MIFDLLIETAVKELPDSVEFKQNDNYSIVKLCTENLTKGFDQWTFMVLLNEEYVADLQSKIAFRNQLLRALRSEIGEEMTKLTILVTVNTRDKLTTIEQLKKYWDLRQFPVFEKDELINDAETSFGQKLVKSILSYSYDNLFTRLNPYSIDIPPKEKMFYGREEVLKKLIKIESNIVVTGPRRIGKTAIVHRLFTELGTVPARGLYLTKDKINKCAYIDLSSLDSYENDIWEKILIGFSYDPSRYLPYARQERGKERFVRYVKSVEKLLSDFNGELVIILDEADSWIEKDSRNNWRILQELRALSDQRKAKIVLVGYETLLTTLKMHECPFIGRYELMKLEPLVRDKVEALTLEPLSELNIKIDPKYQNEFIEQMWLFSGGRPHLVQGFCQNLVESLSDEENKIITKAHFEHVSKTTYVYNEFMESTIHGGRPLAQLICGVASKKMYGKDIERDTISQKEIIEEIQGLGIEYNAISFEINFQHLDLRHIMIYSDDASGIIRFTSNKIKKEFHNLISRVGYEAWAADLINRYLNVN
ncbi:ATP-binding protein [Flavobacteriaceae bacterium 3-367]